MKILTVTSEWPTPTSPGRVPFLVQRIKYLRREGVETKVFFFRGNKNPLNYLAAHRCLRRKYDLRQFDVVHAHFGQSGLVTLPSPRPVVVTFYGSDLQGIVTPSGSYSWKGIASRELGRMIARQATKVVVVARRLAEYLPSEVSPEVIPCGVDRELFFPVPRTEARARLGWSQEKRVVLFAADPRRPVKRYKLAQESISRVPALGEVELCVLADVPHEQVPWYMNASDALVLTSRHEGSPTVVREALACDLPVVSVDVGDVRESVHGIDGCHVCEEASPGCIARALSRVLGPRRRVDGRPAAAVYDEKRLAQKLISLYRAAQSVTRRPEDA
ncbi:MAG: glycosyltransferase [Candidatus Omnitrophica bacterium]|nr:glycosyltransferase [Candidatus Omnitrophota bacterium]